MIIKLFKIHWLEVFRNFGRNLGPNIITVNTVFWAALHSSSWSYIRCELQMQGHVRILTAALWLTVDWTRSRGCLIQMSGSTLSCL